MPFATIQFYVPRAAGNLLDPERVRGRAIAAGVTEARFAASTYRTPLDRTRITCRLEVAQFIVEEFVEMAQTAEGQLLFDLGAAATNALDAMDPRAERRQLPGRD
jgi:hypothetical protein